MPTPRMVTSAVLSAALLLAGSVTPAHAQLHWGPHVVHASKSFDGATGVGLRAGIGSAMVPVGLTASGEYFFPDCPQGNGCGLRGLTVDGTYRPFPSPMVRPYVTGGLAYRHFDPGTGAGSEDVSGLAVGAGIDASLGGLRAFREVRYEFVDAPSSQAVWRLGVLF
jgi:hypothetical protein